jgi:hypothetical protein
MTTRFYGVVLFLLLLHLLVRANDRDEDAEQAAVHYRHLPQSSSDILASHSCKVDDVRRLLEDEDNDDDDGPFFRWVLSARHTTWDPPGWEVASPRPHLPSTSSSRDVPSTAAAEGEDDGDKYYARVFDLLDWSRGRNLLPVPVDISLICHKGMNSSNNSLEGGWSRHSAGLPWDASCTKQLRSTARVSSSSCIDIPGIIVANPPPPMRVNNPCHLPYRMVDGAHRICLRKYLLHVATEELIGLEGVAAAAADYDDDDDDDYDGANENGTTSDAVPNDDGSLHRRMMRLREVIDKAGKGHYLVLDQTTFESMLTNVDPHTHWAKDRHHMKSAVTTELRREWQAWMGRVMDRVWETESDDAALECSSASGTSE